MDKILFVHSEFGNCEPWRYAVLDAFGALNYQYRETNFAEMLDVAQEWQPQLTVAFHPYLPTFEKYARAWEKIGGHKALWTMEDPWEFDHTQAYAHLFGYIITSDKRAAQVLKQSGVNAHHLPHGAMQYLYYPEEVGHAYKTDLCFVGNAYPSRLRFFRAVLPHLKEYRVALIGTGWRALPDTYGQLVVNDGVSNVENRRWMNGAKVVLNLHRLVDDVPIANERVLKPSSPNNRFFEIGACRRLQMVDDSRLPEIKEYYSVNSELLVFESTDHFLQLFLSAMGASDFRSMAAAAAYTRTLQAHKYEQRILSVFAELI